MKQSSLSDTKESQTRKVQIPCTSTYNTVPADEFVLTSPDKLSSTETALLSRFQTLTREQVGTSVNKSILRHNLKYFMAEIQRHMSAGRNQIHNVDMLQLGPLDMKIAKLFQFCFPPSSTSESMHRTISHGGNARRLMINLHYDNIPDFSASSSTKWFRIIYTNEYRDVLRVQLDSITFSYCLYTCYMFASFKYSAWRLIKHALVKNSNNEQLMTDTESQWDITQ